MCKHRFGVTKIIDADIDNLDISWDYTDNENDLSQRVPVFLYTPCMSDKDEHGGVDHYHIALSKEQAETLHSWLSEYLNDVKGDYQ